MSSIMRCRSGLIVLLVIGILLSCRGTNPTSSDRKPRPVASTLNPGTRLRAALYRESGFVLWPDSEVLPAPGWVCYSGRSCRTETCRLDLPYGRRERAADQVDPQNRERPQAR